MSAERLDVQHLRLAGEDAGEHLCWSCQRQTPPQPFCVNCSKLQPFPAETDYFSLFGLERKLSLDQSELEARFYELSRAFHPDFFQQRSRNEQRLSLEYAAMVNRAYRTLRDPWARAEYLIHLEQGVAADIRAEAPGALLEEVLEAQDLIESARRGSADAGRRDELRAVRERFAAAQEELVRQLEALFQHWDETLGAAALSDQERRQKRQAVIQGLHHGLSQRKYLANVVRDIDAVLEA
ncbi:MAG: Fe-S protein assembly co-chaperone HscB [Candidatus Tectomicrobia bacterium]|nr:Fe-S protein assembly co-chaperone HscB [Candidatus Tectomicrobia bacterium]